MRIEVLENAEAVAVRAADLICDVVRSKPAARLGLPTGNTPIATYNELNRRVRDLGHPTPRDFARLHRRLHRQDSLDFLRVEAQICTRSKPEFDDGTRETFERRASHRNHALSAAGALDHIGQHVLGVPAHEIKERSATRSRVLNAPSSFTPTLGCSLSNARKLNSAMDQVASVDVAMIVAVRG